MNKFIFDENYIGSNKGKPKPIEYIVNDNNCYICISHHKEKFGYISIIRYGKRQKMHRYIYELRFGCIPDGIIVRHKCDNPSCINPDHLELGTHVDNVNDRVTRGRCSIRRGIDNHMNKINEDVVISILLDNEGTQNEIAERYGVSQIHVSQIKTGKRWRHITEKYNCYIPKKNKVSLSEQDVVNIFLDKDSTTRELSKKYNISESAISNIRNRKRYTKITDALQ